MKVTAGICATSEQKRASVSRLSLSARSCSDMLRAVRPYINTALEDIFAPGGSSINRINLPRKPDIVRPLPEFPEKFMPFKDEPPGAKVSAGVSGLLGAAIRALRESPRKTLDQEPKRRMRG